MGVTPSASFEAWEHKYIKGHEIDTRGLPFSEAFFSNVFAAAVAPEYVDDSPQRLVQTSPYHCRSYELAYGAHDADGNFLQTADWVDAYDNFYGFLVTKGNNFSEQRIFESGTAPSGYIPYGVLEGDALLRVIKSSDILRANGIDTEWIVKVIEPEQLQFGDKRVSPLEFKQNLMTSGIKSGEIDLAEAAKIGKAIHDMSYFVTIRAVSIPDRPTDFTFDTKDEAMRRATRIMTVYNRTLGPDDEIFDPENIEDRKRYFATELPVMCGYNLGTMHSLGLSHNFPVPSNVNAFGGLIDLDGVTGEPLGMGDEPVGPDNFVHDLVEFMIETDTSSPTLNEVFESLEHLGILHDDGMSLYEFKLATWVGYFAGRNMTDINAENAGDVLRIVGRPEFVEETSCWTYMIDALKEIVGGDLQPEKYMDVAAIAQQLQTTIKDELRDMTYGTLDRMMQRGEDIVDETNIEAIINETKQVGISRALLHSRTALQAVLTEHQAGLEFQADLRQQGISEELIPHVLIACSVAINEQIIRTLDQSEYIDPIVVAIHSYADDVSALPMDNKGMDEIYKLISNDHRTDNRYRRARQELFEYGVKRDDAFAALASLGSNYDINFYEADSEKLIRNISGSPVRFSFCDQLVEEGSIAVSSYCLHVADALPNGRLPVGLELPKNMDDEEMTKLLTLAQKLPKETYERLERILERQLYPDES